MDCGGDLDEAAADAAVHMLLSQGITQLDGVIVTHYDDDHAASVPYVLSRIPAKQLYLPEVPDTGKNRDTLESMGGEWITWIPPETVCSIEDAGITLIMTSPQRSDNENSMCILFQTQDCDILITGDRGPVGEKALLAISELPDLEVLVVGHHGAKGVATLELLSETHPEIALISVSRDNLYGHPAEDVLERLALFDCAVLSTAQEGTIMIRG